MNDNNGSCDGILIGILVAYRRISIVNFVHNHEWNCSNFEKLYTHLVDLVSTNLSTIVLTDPMYGHGDNDMKSRPSIFYAEFDKSEGMDSVETLTSGPVMAALRNENFNAPKSVSSDSFRLADDAGCWVLLIDLFQ